MAGTSCVRFADFYDIFLYNRDLILAGVPGLNPPGKSSSIATHHFVSGANRLPLVCFRSIIAQNIEIKLHP